jgi:glycosyltransferase involved in cell wall biosynthesis
MKIAQVCPRFHPCIGGVEIHVKEISQRLSSKYDIEVLTTDPSKSLQKEERINSLVVRRFNSFAPSDAYFFSSALKKYIKENFGNYDVVHAHSYHALPAYYTACAKKDPSKTKLIFTPHYHGKGHSFVRNLLHRPYRLLGSKILKKSDAIICVSEYEKNLLLRNFRVDCSIHTIPNGINIEEFADIVKSEKSDGSRKILYVGRLEKYKGIDYVIKVMSALDSSYRIEIIGDGSYKRNLIKLVEKLNLNDRVHFHQSLGRGELIKKYAEASLLVLLSKHEAYGLVVAEALAAKTPCIVANEAALAEWVDNRNVFGVDYPVDIEKLAELIESVSGVSVENLRLRSWDDVAEGVSKVYESVLE